VVWINDLKVETRSISRGISPELLLLVAVDAMLSRISDEWMFCLLSFSSNYFLSSLLVSVWQELVCHRLASIELARITKMGIVVDGGWG